MAASITRSRMYFLCRISRSYAVFEAAIRPLALLTRCYSQRGSTDSEMESLATKGFLRPLKSYSPLRDVEQQVLAICASVLNRTNTDGPELRSHQLASDPLSKFKILSTCISRFGHDIPNSQLHKMKTIDDLIGYFKMPVKTSTTYEDMATSTDLPPNVYIQQEYIRFHPDTDTKFKGVSAFGKNDNIVSGLKAKKKYKGFKLSTTWPPPKE